MRAGLRLALFVLCASSASAASAEVAFDRAPQDAGPPHIRGLHTIPSNGALLIESASFTTPSAVITDPEGAAVTGRLDFLMALDERALHAWLPEADLALGTYTIAFPDQGSEPMSFEVVAALSDELPAISSEPSVSVVTQPIVQACCTDPLSNELSASCFVSQEEISIQLSPGLSSGAGAVGL